MNILIAPDSFKQSLEALEVCRAIESGFRQVFTDATYTLLPMADGGEGTTAALSYALEGRWITTKVHDPLMRAVDANYLLLADDTAVIEIAEACGLALLTSAEQNPLITSSYGVGELILDALENGAQRFIIGLGGSATNDAGLGMLMALGVRFYDANDNALTQGGAQLANVQRIDTSTLHPKAKALLAQSTRPFAVACDVTNPLCGVNGASAVFGPQKGGSDKQVAILDKALAHFAHIYAQQNMQDDNDDYQKVAGAGAAGGLGFAFMAFLNSELQSGFDLIAKATRLSAHIAKADLVITGEGKLDAQTMMGKVANGVGLMAKAQNKPVIAICGAVDHEDYHKSAHNESAMNTLFAVVMPSIQQLAPIDEVFNSAYTNIETTALNLAAAMRLGEKLN
ncbi:glycerate kinase [uncultured Psychrobacter sp.]|uniref:glycerate kinase n=1 Tax=uncultured Psychrobacter sp. TaxID=259303 RepID=UPI0026243D85|nr:glycerate kinase [uncultured Psychrobacter sp.]